METYEAEKRQAAREREKKKIPRLFISEIIFSPAFLEVVLKVLMDTCSNLGSLYSHT